MSSYRLCRGEEKIFWLIDLGDQTFDGEGMGFGGVVDFVMGDALRLIVVIVNLRLRFDGCVCFGNGLMSEKFHMLYNYYVLAKYCF